MSKDKFIVATSGGFITTNRWGVMRPGATFLKALELTRKERPKVCFMMTASGDDAAYISRSYEAMGNLSVDVTHLSLFPQPNEDVEKRLLNSDLVWVGGGSVANLLAIWKLHKVDEVLKTAWANGTVLSGVSAGSICWFMGGTTDSFGPDLKLVSNGLGLLPYGNGVHYDSEEQRRPLLQSLVKDETFETAFATDDHTGIVFKGIEPIEVISDVKSDPLTGPAAYKIQKINGEIQEIRLAPGAIV